MPPISTPDPFSDEGFLDRLRSRDEAALHKVTGALLPQVYRAARGAGLTVQNAEDVTQDTIVTFIEKIDQFAGRSHVRTWLFGILYRKISEMRRRAQREEGAEDIDEVMETRFKTNGFWAQPPRSADGEAFDRDVRRHLQECLEDLGSDQRLAFVLREVEEMESRDICQVMEVSRSNLGVLLYRGRNSLRECLEKRGHNG